MTHKPKVEPSPEVKAALRKFVAVQKEKYGDDWKEKLSTEMAAQAAPVLGRLITALDAAKQKQ